MTCCGWSSNMLGFCLNQLKLFNISSFGPPSQSSIKTKYIRIYWIYIPFSNAMKPLTSNLLTFAHPHSSLHSYHYLKACFFLELQLANWESMKYWLNKRWWESKYAKLSDGRTVSPPISETNFVLISSWINAVGNANFINSSHLLFFKKNTFFMKEKKIIANSPPGIFA